MARTDEPIKTKNPKSKVDTKNPKGKVKDPNKERGRDLSKPLSESKFDPADKNKDGWVSSTEQKEYNKVQKLKRKEARKKKPKGEKIKNALTTVGTIGAGIVGASEAYKKVKNNISN